MQHSLWTGRACVTYAVLVLLTVAAGTLVSDRFISGNWAVQGLGKLNATFITHVCIEITGNKASETWYMRSKIREDQQAVLKTDAIEVKYTIESDLIFNHTAVASWEDAEGRDTAGGVQFVATAVKFVDATPARFKPAMTEERQKFVGRSRYCLYQYVGSPARLAMRLSCSSTAPTDGFYRFGETEGYPATLNTAHCANLQRGFTCEAASTPALWPARKQGYRIELSLAPELEETESQKQNIMEALADELTIPVAALELVQMVRGSTVMRVFVESPQIPSVAQSVEKSSTQFTQTSGVTLAKFPVIGMSGSWHPAAEESEAGVDDETELRPVMLPIMLSVCMLGVLLFAIAFWLLAIHK